MSPLATYCLEHGLIRGGGQCEQCKQKDNRRRHLAAKANGIKSQWWVEFREGILRRDGYRCTWIGEDGERCKWRVALVVDYKPGGRHSRNPADYQTLCNHHSGVKDGARRG